MTTPVSTLPLAQDIGWTAGTITGRIKAPDGSVSSPGIQFRDDSNTGFYRIGADSIGVATAGFMNITFSSAGIILGSNMLAVGGKISGQRDVVTARTSDLTLNDSSNSGCVWTNTGATGEVILTLPSASNTGTKYQFVVDAAQYLRVKAAGTDTIRDAATVSAAAGYIRANVAGSVLEVTCVASGKWFVTIKNGTWTVDS